jgi:phospholipid transport system substrate-binding protein
MNRSPLFALGLALLTLAGLAFGVPAAADPSTSTTISAHEVLPAEVYVQALASRVMGVLASTRSDAEKEHLIRSMIDSDLDGDAIAKYTLGSLWRSATPEEFGEFVTLLKEYASSFYQGRLNEYSGAKVTVSGSVASGKRAVVVGSTVSNLKSGDPVQIDWLVVRTGESFKLIDFRFQGVWIARSWGDQFASIISKNGGKFSALNEHLKLQVATAQ